MAATGTETREPFFFFLPAWFRPQETPRIKTTSPLLRRRRDLRVRASPTWTPAPCLRRARRRSRSVQSARVWHQLASENERDGSSRSGSAGWCPCVVETTSSTLLLLLLTSLGGLQMDRSVSVSVGVVFGLSGLSSGMDESPLSVGSKPVKHTSYLGPVLSACVHLVPPGGTSPEI